MFLFMPCEFDQSYSTCKDVTQFTKSIQFLKLRVNFKVEVYSHNSETYLFTSAPGPGMAESLVPTYCQKPSFKLQSFKADTWKLFLTGERSTYLLRNQAHTHKNEDFSSTGSLVRE